MTKQEEAAGLLTWLLLIVFSTYMILELTDTYHAIDIALTQPATQALLPTHRYNPVFEARPGITCQIAIPEGGIYE